MNTTRKLVLFLTLTLLTCAINAQVAINTDGTWAVFSDERPKENVNNYQKGLKEK